jgi:surface antigen
MKKVLVGVSAALILAGCTAQPQPYYQAQPAPRPARTANVGDSCGDLGWGKLAGAALGGAAGGLIGSQVGRGTGNSLATAAGAIGGLLLGGFAGSSVDKVNCAEARAAQQQALQPTTPIGRTIQWSDPQSGATGSFTPTREGRQASGAYCREFRQTIIIGGEQKEGVGQACQQPDGSWKTVS